VWFASSVILGSKGYATAGNGRSDKSGDQASVPSCGRMSHAHACAQRSLRAEGSDANEAIAAIQALFETSFGEE